MHDLYKHPGCNNDLARFEKQCMSPQRPLQTKFCVRAVLPAVREPEELIKTSPSEVPQRRSSCCRNECKNKIEDPIKITRFGPNPGKVLGCLSALRVVPEPEEPEEPTSAVPQSSWRSRSCSAGETKAILFPVLPYW
ncbi:hypothetical protein AOLI_G00136750 [Acnodon oligacanthus]